MITPRRRYWVALLAVILVVAVGGSYVLLDRLKDIQLEADEWLLLPLSLGVVILALGLTGVLIRNLVVLIVERKRGILGARLRTKLVFFFLALVLVPAIVLFTGSVQVIKQTVEGILEDTVEHLKGGESVVAYWTDFFRDESLQTAATVAETVAENDLLRYENRSRLHELLERSRTGDRLQWIAVEQRGRILAMATDPDRPEIVDDLRSAAAEMTDQARREAKPVTRIEKLDPLVAQAAYPVGETGATVAVSRELPASIAASLRGIDAAVSDFKKFRAKRRELIRLYVTLIGLVFLSTLFVATWVGMYLARRITGPLHDVAAAAREISGGNLEVRVQSDVGDEMGMLVDAFNEMAGELQENREVITRSTAQLRRSSRAAEERRRYIETLIANLSTAVVSLDPTGRVTTANPAVERILGMPLKVGQSAREELSRHGLDRLADGLDRALHTESVSLRRDLELPGSLKPLNISVQISTLRSRSQEQLGTLIMVEDLTELLRAQRALAWQEVARRIAHEIKNPLTPIQLAAQRLRKKFQAGADDLEQVVDEATASIEHEVGGLKQLVDEFSRYARMPEVVPRPTDFGKVVELVLGLYKGLPEIRWEVEIEEKMGVVKVDPQQMRRALMNLIDNAVAALHGRGTIRVAVHARAADGGLHIEVADSGPGIPVADRDKMFVPYFSTKHRGTGLGLAIVHKVITDHRGTIRVEDNSPSGARFVIEIPA